MKANKNDYKVAIGILLIFSGICFIIYSMLLQAAGAVGFMYFLQSLSTLVFFILGCISLAMVPVGVIEMRKEFPDETNI